MHRYPYPLAQQSALFHQPVKGQWPLMLASLVLEYEVSCAGRLGGASLSVYLSSERTGVDRRSFHFHCSCPS